MGQDRRGDGGGRTWGDTGGAPGTDRGGGVSRSVAKASRGGIGVEQKRGISTILSVHSGAIGAFATDLDNLRRRGRRRGSPGGAPRAGRRPRRELPDAETRTSHSKVQFQPLFSSAKCTSRRGSGRGAVLADRGADPAPEHLRRPGEKGASYFMLRINPGASVLVDRVEGRLPGLLTGERGAARSMRSEDGSDPSKIPALASIPGPREGSAARDAGPVRARAPPPIGRSTEIIRPGRPIGLTNGMSGSDGWRVLSQF